MSPNDTTKQGPQLVTPGSFVTCNVLKGSVILKLTQSSSITIYNSQVAKLLRFIFFLTRHHRCSFSYEVNVFASCMYTSIKATLQMLCVLVSLYLCCLPWAWYSLNSLVKRKTCLQLYNTVVLVDDATLLSTVLFHIDCMIINVNCSVW